MRRAPMRDKQGNLFLADVHDIPLEVASSSGIAISIIRQAPESGLMKGSAGAQIEPEIQEFLKRICASHQWEYGEIWIPHPEGYLEFCTNWSATAEVGETLGLLSASIRFKMGEGAPGRTWESGQPELLRDILKSPGRVFRRGFMAKALGLRSYFSMPIKYVDRVLAVATFFGSEVRYEVLEDLVETHAALNGLMNRFIDEQILDNTGMPTEFGLTGEFSDQEVPRWICEPDTLAVLDINKAVMIQSQQNRYQCLQSSLQECLERQGRLLVDERSLLPENMNDRSFVPYRFKDDGVELWGVLEVRFIPWHNGYALSAHAYDSPNRAAGELGRKAERFKSLTPREREILGLAISGWSSKHIGRHLAISHRTVETHRTSIMRKLGLRTFAQVAKAYGSLLG